MTLMTTAPIYLHSERADAIIKLGNHVVIVPEGCEQPYHLLTRGYETAIALTCETALTCLCRLDF